MPDPSYPQVSLDTQADWRGDRFESRSAYLVQHLSPEIDLQSMQREILEGIPQDSLPPKREIPTEANRAPKRPLTLSTEECEQAITNALRYFPDHLHNELAVEFAEELRDYGHIYMYRYMPSYPVKAIPLDDIPHVSTAAGCIMGMILNNLDPRVAQHPYELITYGGNGAVFQNWVQYRLTMQALAHMTDYEQIPMYSGHPMGIFPADPDMPRVVVTNGMMIGMHSTLDAYTKAYALGVTNYGQMTAGSYMYIGPQGIVHGTTITVLNAGRLHCGSDLRGKLFVTSGLGGMSGAQAKAGPIAEAVTVIAEVNEKAIKRRFEQGWVDEVLSELDVLLDRIRAAKQNKEPISLAYHGNVVDLWEALAGSDIEVELGSDQTSLHNPFQGGYYPADMTFDEAQDLMWSKPDQFKRSVESSLKRQVTAINKLADRGMYFFDYGNSFLAEAQNAGAEIMRDTDTFRYPSYVEDIMGPMCFDYGFGPFRWVCMSQNPEDLRLTDGLAVEVLQQQSIGAPGEIAQQIDDNIKWIKSAAENELVVGSQARILYSNLEGRISLAVAFNEAIRNGLISGPIVIGRDHHDVGGTDSPRRETSNIKDGSNVTADMAVHNFIGGGMRGASWVSLHNGGGTGWGTAINGGFGLVLDGTPECEERVKKFIFWDVVNGIARRARAGNAGAVWTLNQIEAAYPEFRPMESSIADPEVVTGAVKRVFRK